LNELGDIQLNNEPKDSNISPTTYLKKIVDNINSHLIAENVDNINID